MKNGWQWERMTHNMLLNPQWLVALSSYPSLYIGFSGGLDSTVLLHALADAVLPSKLSVIHVNHGLSKNAQVWEHHCQSFCEKLGISFYSAALTLEGTHNLEARARDARYETFARFLAADPQAALVLAHHADDQVETFLLNLLRGAGIDGLSGMPEVSTFRPYPLLRPFLSLTRTALWQYAKDHGLTWVDDESNMDITFSRNYIRHALMPVLHSRWPKAVENIQRTMQHCRQAQHNLRSLAYLDCDSVTLEQKQLPNTLLIKLSPERRVNVLRTWLDIHAISQPSASILRAIVDDVILGREDAQAQVRWGKTIVRRYNGALYLLESLDNPPLSVIIWRDFPTPLALEELNASLFATESATGVYISCDAQIEIRFRKGGETMIVHGQTKSLKKLMQMWKVPVWERDRVPLLYVNDVLQAVIGYVIADQAIENGVKSQSSYTLRTWHVTKM